MIYANAFAQTLHSRPIGPDGTLGAATTRRPRRHEPALPRDDAERHEPLRLRRRPRLQPDRPSCSSTSTRRAARSRRRRPASVGWPGGGPTEIARMTVSPDGRHLYAASGAGRRRHRALRHRRDRRAHGRQRARRPPTTAARRASLAIAPGGLFAYAPTSITGLAPPGEIRQFSRDPATGALAPLALPGRRLRRRADLPTRDAVASPDGASLYLGQDGNVGEWTIASGGALLPRANLAIAGRPAGERGDRPRPVPSAGRVVHRDARARRPADDVRRVGLVGPRRQRRALRLGLRRRHHARRRRARAEPRLRDRRDADGAAHGDRRRRDVDVDAVDRHADAAKRRPLGRRRPAP